MHKNKFLVSLSPIFLLLTFFSISSAEDSITVTTYYPSPYGVYNYLLTDKLGVGDNNGDNILSSADVPTTAGDVWIKGNVGIRTTSPWARLTASDVSGSDAMNLYAGPAVSSLTFPQASGYINRSANAAVSQNSSTLTTAFIGLNESNSTNESYGIYGQTWANNTASPKGAAVGTYGLAMSFGSGNVSILTGIRGDANAGATGTVAIMSSLYANTNGRTAGTVSLNAGLYLEDQSAVPIPPERNYQIYSNTASPFVIRSNTGNVGIGTASPGAKLHVQGGTIRVAGAGAPVTGGALCLNASGNMGKCTSVVDASGNCTCP